MDIALDIIVEDDKWNTIEIKRQFKNVISSILTEYNFLRMNYDVVELCVLLTDSEKIQSLNSNFRNKDTPTNVLSFPDNGEKYWAVQSEYSFHNNVNKLHDNNILSNTGILRYFQNSTLSNIINQSYDDRSTIGSESINSKNFTLKQEKQHKDLTLCHQSVVTNEDSIDADKNKFEYEVETSNNNDLNDINNNVCESDSISADQKTLYLGDIVMCFEVINQQSISLQKTFQNHCVHLIVHSVLHLLGYDHITEYDANVMEGLEIRILQSHGILNPYVI